MTTSTERPDGGELNSEIVRLIDELRRDEGDSVTFISDNPDFNGQPNCAIVCNGDWTGYEDRRFAADTILDALSSAATERKLPTARQVIAESNGHHWVQRFNLVCCRDCGIVRRADDKNSPCKGIVTVELRTPTNESPAPQATKKTYIKPLRTIVEIDARYADQIRDLLNAPAPQATEKWCQPADIGKHLPRKFIVMFEDAEQGYALFDDEAEARAFYAKATIAWNCYLFGALPAAPHPPVEGLREWFNSFRGDHGKTEWDQLLSILVSPSLTAGPVGYISPETLAELTNNANGVGPVVASAAYSTVIPLYAAPATLTEQPSEAPPSAPDVREALEPFVAALDGCVDESARDDDHIWESPAAMNITVGNLRVLRAIYETLQPSEYREDRAIARVMASKTAALSQQPVAVADRGAIIRECASIAVDHTPKKFEGTLAAHATGRAIECAILALLSAQPAKGER